MGYIHIENLYKGQDILLFKECYALEKIHGTSAKVQYRRGEGVTYSSGGSSHKVFCSLFNDALLLEKCIALGREKVTIHGEAYGGKCQGMSGIYGKDLRFIVFDIKLDDTWLCVPDMDQLAQSLGFEVVDWHRVPTDVEVLNTHRDNPSVQAARNGCGEDKPREGIVIRPLIELRKNNDERIIAKHKQEAFSERDTPQKIVDPAKLKVLAESEAIAQEWVTEMRLTHVLDKLKAETIEATRDVVAAMVEDVLREAAGEIVDSRAARRAVGSRAARLFHERLRSALEGE